MGTPAITLDQFATFVSVIDTGSLDGAALELAVTPSAISQRLKSLETSAGAVLVRRGSPAEATEAGLRLLPRARQLVALHRETVAELQGSDRERIRVPIAVNGDSLATWLLRPLVEAARRGRIQLDIRRADQRASAELLRRGEVLAAVTGEASAVPGCRVVPLGLMRYVPVASPEFVTEQLAGNPGSRRALATAPRVDYDSDDQLQSEVLVSAVHGADGPRHTVPSSVEFADAIRWGLGWGMLPTQQCSADLAQGSLVRLTGLATVDEALYLQHWSIATAPRAKSRWNGVITAIEAAARAQLLPADRRSSTRPRPAST